MLAAININFDSLSETYGFPQDFRDPIFFQVADRFVALSEKYGFKYSIYVLGKDLEKSENRNVVRQWAKAGHEIGNHSWSHPLNLGAMPQKALREEVERAHAIIHDTVGDPPRGFIAPAWSTSSALLDILIDNGYEYDTSCFPSWLMVPALGKMALNHIGGRQFRNLWSRKDGLLWLAGPRQAYRSCGKLFSEGTCRLMPGIQVLPLPTNSFRMACWHTLVFVLGWTVYEKLLRSCLSEVESFYYLVHPADLMAPEDLDPVRSSTLERMSIPLKTKLKYLERALEIILDSGRTLVTMQELARLSSQDDVTPIFT